MTMTERLIEYLFERNMKSQTGEHEKTYNCPKCAFELILDSDPTCPFCGVYLPRAYDGPDTAEEYNA